MRLCQAEELFLRTPLAIRDETCPGTTSSKVFELLIDGRFRHGLWLSDRV